MDNPILNHLQNIGSGSERGALTAILGPIASRLNSQALTSAGLVIKAGGGVLAKTGGSTTYCLVNGKLVSIASGTDMPALTGLNITAANFNVACFFLKEDGTTAVKFGREATSIGSVKFPSFPDKHCLIGFLLITHSSAFTGNTTALDTATTVYFSPVGAVDPTIIFN